MFNDTGLIASAYEAGPVDALRNEPVVLDPCLPTRRATTAIAERCKHLTATETRYPGTDLVLRYEVKTCP